MIKYVHFTDEWTGNHKSSQQVIYCWNCERAIVKEHQLSTYEYFNFPIQLLFEQIRNSIFKCLKIVTARLRFRFLHCCAVSQFVFELGRAPAIHMTETMKTVIFISHNQVSMLKVKYHYYPPVW